MKSLITPFPDKDLYYMGLALREAKKAFKADEVPIGAVVVDSDGQVMSKGRNQVEAKHTQTAHAECLAIAKAGKKLKDWRMQGYWIYVTLEPCAMCMNLILLSRLEGVVFGAQSPLFGFRLDNNLSLQLYKKRTPKIIEGIGKKEAEELLRLFFKNKRKKG